MTERADLVFHTGTFSSRGIEEVGVAHGSQNWEELFPGTVHDVEDRGNGSFLCELERGAE